MTENEVTQELKQLYDRTDSIYKSDKLDDMFKTIIISLEEIQQYRAIGTVEEIVDGIKQSEEEFNMLMEYLHIGTIDEVKALEKQHNNGWIPVDERLPDTKDYILLSFSNFTIPVVGRYEAEEDGSGAFYIGDEVETCVSQMLFVNAWMPLPEPYKESEEE